MTVRRKTVKTETAQKAPMTHPAAAGTPDAQAAERFLRLMSHEMRTPLNGVIGMLGLLARTRMDGAQRAYVSAARDSAEHLLGLVNDLLDYARVDAGHLELDSAPVDLEGLVQGVAELLSPRAHDKGLSLVWTVAPDAPDVLADEGRLRQILFNLAGNAVKFTETGGVRIAIERAGGRDSRPKLAFIIDDTGPGVPAEARARIFEEFGHVDASDAARFDGAGLGLAVVKKLAEAMDGKVCVTDRPGGGARFLVEAAFPGAPGAVAGRATPLKGVAVAVKSPDPLVAEAVRQQVEACGGTVKAGAVVTLVDHAAADPGAMAACPVGGRCIVLLKAEERELIARYRSQGFHGYLIKPLRRASLAERVLAAIGRGDAPVGGPPPPQRDDDRVTPVRFAGLRVLLAEDNPVNALLAKTLLRREGCVVETAGSGDEAVQALTRARYDLVLMDMRMPGMDGLAAARAIRARGDRTPIVALTANAFVEDRKACLEAGMDDHLTKPIDTDALRSALARWTSGELRAKVAC
jgi:CheY-like chemotaxis protein